MKLSKYLFLALIPVAGLLSCKKEFVAANINPSTLTAVDPGNQFLYAAVHCPDDFETFYDYYRAIMPWMQYLTGSAGNAPNFTIQSGNFNYRYGNFYTNVGLALTDIPHLIAKMPAAQQPGRVYENAIASIYKAYYTFYVSDINGDIPYSQAFQARYGGTLTPAYDTQQGIFDTLDAQIKTAVTTLETAQPTAQVVYGGYDPFYGGSAAAWAKAGNALRLKIAMRLLKRNASGAQAIVQSVLSDANNQMSSVADSWVLDAGPAFATEQSNYNPTGLLAAKPVVDFMNKYNDPRIGIFYRKNSFGVYTGSPTNPDTCALQFYQNLYTAKDTPFSPIQHRLFTPNYDENDGFGPGSGSSFFPVITYAEYCFIRADLAARGVTTDNAGNWYNAGVTASITFYDNMAKMTGISGYQSVTGQIAGYLLQPGIQFNAATAEEQIACQAYLDFYRQPSEAWAWWKRTGYPNSTSIIPWTPLTTNGSPLTLNRRAALSPLPASDANYANQQAAFTQMASDPTWGGTPGNAQGRVWWDMQ